MKITEKQAQMLYQILIDSLNIVGGIGYSQETRKDLANSIINQQDDDILIDLTRSKEQKEE